MNPRPKTFSQELIHAYPLVLSSRLIQRLGESFGFGQPGLSCLPAPDEVGKTSLVYNVSATVQAPAAKRAAYLGGECQFLIVGSYYLPCV